MLLSLLCITVSGSCSYLLSVISDMLQHYCAWRCTLFWLIPHIQIQYGPLSLHVANTFCICSPLAGHILLSGSFWCLLPGLELLQVVPLFLLSNYLTTICWWWLCLHEASLGSLDTGHAMLCFSTFPLSLTSSLTFNFFPSKLPGRHRRCTETVTIHATLHWERRVSVYERIWKFDLRYR